VITTIDRSQKNAIREKRRKLAIENTSAGMNRSPGNARETTPLIPRLGVQFTEEPIVEYRKALTRSSAGMDPSSTQLLTS
jgi:predicted Ser/Thr protein kinase